MAIIKRLVKGSALSHTELDGNFTDLDGRVTTLENTADSDGQTLTLAGDNLTISGGNTVDLSTINSTGILNVVEDTTPQLGGNLELNGNQITGGGGSSISELLNVLTLVGGSNGIIMRTIGSGNIVIGDQAGDVVLGNSSSSVEFVNGVEVDLSDTNVNFTNATVTGLSVVQSIDDLTDVDTSTTPPGVGQVLKWDGAQWEPANDSSGSGGITLTALSVTQASAGTAGLVYNNVTGVFTYTPPDLSTYLTSVPAQTFASLTGKPTTLAGYGITDASSASATETLTNKTINTASNTITIVEADISDLGSYLTSVPAQTFASLTDINNANGPDIIAIGTLSSAGVEAVSIGKNTGSGGDYSQAIGNNAGNSGQGVAAVALGSQSGETSQGDKAVAVGQYAGQTTQSSQAIAIGNNAGNTTQGSYAVAIGRNAGETTQGAGGIAVGSGAGKTTQGLSGIAIGYLAGESNQGGGAIAIGANAGTLNQAADSIILNASNTALENTQTGSFVVKPVRNASGTHALEYNPTTGEVTYDTASGGLPSRSTATSTTGSLADTAQADLDITGFKSYTLLTITTDKAARVRLYVNAATRTADAARAEGTDPAADAGLIAEVITTGAETVIISPGAYGFNLESTPTTNIPCRVTNKSGSTGTVQIDLNILQLEA